MSALFSKIKPSSRAQVEGKVKDETRNESDIELKKIDKEEVAQAGSMAFSGVGGTETHKVLRGFYVSEKASAGIADNQYMFKVFNNANKSEVKKEVSRLFKVEIKSIKILNMPEKRRDFGKHPGSKSGFKKAIVILKPGYMIGQAKP